jgi:GTP cyclohydrolase FolE2
MDSQRSGLRKEKASSPVAGRVGGSGGAGRPAMHVTRTGARACTFARRVLKWACAQKRRAGGEREEDVVRILTHKQRGEISRFFEEIQATARASFERDGV